MCVCPSVCLCICVGIWLNMKALFRDIEVQKRSKQTLQDIHKPTHLLSLFIRQPSEEMTENQLVGRPTENSLSVCISTTGGRCSQTEYRCKFRAQWFHAKKLHQPEETSKPGGGKHNSI